MHLVVWGSVCLVFPYINKKFSITQNETLTRDQNLCSLLLNFYSIPLELYFQLFSNYISS